MKKVTHRTLFTACFLSAFVSIEIITTVVEYILC